MIERQPSTFPIDGFLDELPEGTVEWAGEIGRKIMEQCDPQDFERLIFAERWLAANENDPTANPDYQLYYEQVAERLRNRLMQPITNV